MQCKVCQCEIVDDRYRLVAKWPFCLECFEQLGAKPSGAKAEGGNLNATQVMAPSAAQAPLEHGDAPTLPGLHAPPAPRHDGAAGGLNPQVPAPPRYDFTQPPAGGLNPQAPAAPRYDGAASGLNAQAPAEPSRSAKHTRCIACNRALSPNEEAPFGICVQCRTGLIAEPFKKLLEQDNKEAAEREKAREAAEAAAAAAAPVEVVTPGVLGKKTCAQCGRRLLEPGGYHVIDGQWFCPSCAHAAQTNAKPSEVKHQASAGPASMRAPGAPGGALPAAMLINCDACDRPTLSNDFDRIEGFSLCRPCVSVDLDGALSLARARHRAKLKKLKDEFLG